MWGRTCVGNNERRAAAGTPAVGLVASLPKEVAGPSQPRTSQGRGSAKRKALDPPCPQKTGRPTKSPDDETLASEGQPASASLLPRVSPYQSAAGFANRFVVLPSNERRCRHRWSVSACRTVGSDDQRTAGSATLIAPRGRGAPYDVRWTASARICATVCLSCCGASERSSETDTMLSPLRKKALVTCASATVRVNAPGPRSGRAFT